MILPLPLHLLLHFSLAVLVGFYVGCHFKKIWLGIIAGILGGFLIDLDHVLEYFLVFGLHFNFSYFITGREFLISDKMHVWFHAWEYAPFLLLAAWLFWRNKKNAVATFLCALACGGLVHLTTDCIVNQFSSRNYSLIYRAQKNFSAPLILSPEQYQKNLEEKVELGL